MIKKVNAISWYKAIRIHVDKPGNLLLCHGTLATQKIGVAFLFLPVPFFSLFLEQQPKYLKMIAWPNPNQ